MPPKKATEDVKSNVVAFGRVRKNLKMGCVGLPNVGKSSLFNLLTDQNAAAENYPFCTIEPNEARCAVPDARYVCVIKFLSFAWIRLNYKILFHFKNLFDFRIFLCSLFPLFLIDGKIQFPFFVFSFGAWIKTGYKHRVLSCTSFCIAFKPWLLPLRWCIFPLCFWPCCSQCIPSKTSSFTSEDSVVH